MKKQLILIFVIAFILPRISLAKGFEEFSLKKGLYFGVNAITTSLEIDDRYSTTKFPQIDPADNPFNDGIATKSLYLEDKDKEVSFVLGFNFSEKFALEASYYETNASAKTSDMKILTQGGADTIHTTNWYSNLDGHHILISPVYKLFSYQNKAIHIKGHLSYDTYDYTAKITQRNDPVSKDIITSADVYSDSKSDNDFGFGTSLAYEHSLSDEFSIIAEARYLLTSEATQTIGSIGFIYRM